ncbi:MAG: helix-turn-helix domain-containing protein [Eggerthellaceae bacterium]|nr:helix-turn-helix domain-containing protein [Eggerthellaceae bacterium]
MLLNADIVFDNLPSDLNASMAGPKTMDLALQRPVLYTGKGPFEADRLYLLNAERIPPREHTERGCTIVCIGDSPLLERYRKRCCVISVARDADFYRTFNVLQCIFDEYDAWENNLRDIVERHDDIEKLLTASEQVFDNPLYVIDGDFMVLGTSSKAATLSSNPAAGSSDGRSLSLGAFDQFLEVYDLSMSEKEPLVLTLLDQTTLNFNLFEADVYAGCLTVHYTGRPYRPSDKPLIRVLGKHVLESMQQLAAHAPEGIGSLRQALQALVEERPLDALERDVIDAANSGRRFVCLRLKLSNQLEQLPLGYVRNAIEGTFPNCVVFEYHHNSIVAMVDIDALGNDDYRESITKGIEPFTGSMEMNAGVSNPFDDLRAARYLFFQANHALDIGLLFDPGKGLYFFEDYALRQLVMNSVSNMRLELLFPEGLRKLIAHDKASPTSYVETLRTYLENNLSIAKTANELYVHRSTLMERLSRIKRELDLDFEDPDEQLRLRILLQAMQARDELRSAQDTKRS